MPPSRRPVVDNAPQHFARPMPSALGLKPPSHRGCVPLTCVVLGIWGYPKHIYSRSALLRQSIWFVSLPGSMAIRLLLPAFLLSKGFITRRKEFASSVDRVERTNSVTHHSGEAVNSITSTTSKGANHIHLPVLHSNRLLSEEVNHLC